jgi:hypothetical protein
MQGRPDSRFLSHPCLDMPADANQDSRNAVSVEALPRVDAKQPGVAEPSVGMKRRRAVL